MKLHLFLAISALSLASSALADDFAKYSVGTELSSSGYSSGPEGDAKTLTPPAIVSTWTTINDSGSLKARGVLHLFEYERVKDNDKSFLPNKNVSTAKIHLTTLTAGLCYNLILSTYGCLDKGISLMRVTQGQDSIPLAADSGSISLGNYFSKGLQIGFRMGVTSASFTIDDHTKQVMRFVMAPSLAWGF